MLNIKIKDIDNIPTEISQNSCISFKGVILFITKSIMPNINNFPPLKEFTLIDSAAQQPIKNIPPPQELVKDEYIILNLFLINKKQTIE